MSEGPGGAWFREWFGEEYLRLYPHRDADEAVRAVELLLEVSDLAAGTRVLDLACGAGRHLHPLRAAGLTATGLDLSRPLLRRAAARVGSSGLVCGDMRSLPFATGVFGAVAQFFTSFGYFATREEDRRVLGEVRRVLADGGAFLLDFLNADRVREDLVPEDTKRIEGRTVRQVRWLDDDTVVKRIEIEDPGGGSPEVFHERVRLYEPRELGQMLAAAGLEPRTRYGDYRGRPFRSDESPRLLILGEAA